MSTYELAGNLFVSPTPGGAYYAVAGPGDEPYRRLLKALLQLNQTPALTIDGLRQWSGVGDDEKAMNVLHHLQGLGWVEGLEQPSDAPAGALEDLLPELLTGLSISGKALLADDQGFYVAARGFPHEAAEELSALSADIASLHERHKRLLANNLGLSTAAWGLVDAAGNSQVGFWPLFVGASRFVLVLGGVPRMNQPALLQLIWGLSTRYGD
jgi:hypothetical protein